MNKFELKSLIKEVIKEVRNKSETKQKLNRVVSSYITSPGEKNPCLYINIQIEAKDMDCAEKCRKDILSDLEKNHDIKIQKET
jgi:hypothetical protein